MDSNEYERREPQDHISPDFEPEYSLWDWPDGSFGDTWSLDITEETASVQPLPAPYTWSMSPDHERDLLFGWGDGLQAPRSVDILTHIRPSSDVLPPHTDNNGRNQMLQHERNTPSSLDVSFQAFTDNTYVDTNDIPQLEADEQGNVASPSTMIVGNDKQEPPAVTEHPLDETRLRAQRIWQSSPSRRRTHPSGSPYPTTLRPHRSPAPTRLLNFDDLVKAYIAKCKNKCFRPDGRRHITPLRGIYPCTAPCGWSTSRPHDWRRHEESRQPQTFFICEVCTELVAHRGGDPFINHRMDKLKEHLAKVHGAKDTEGTVIAERCRVDYEAPFERDCPVNDCQAVFVNWNERLSHIMDHFR